MAIETRQIMRNEPVTLSSPGFSRSGWKLSGWVTAEDRGLDILDYQVDETVEGGFDDDNTDLYAVWKRDLLQCTMTISPTAYTSSDNLSVCEWSGLRPDVSVLSGDTPLTLGREYTLQYTGDSGKIVHSAEGTIVSAAAISAFGAGEYSGVLIRKYTISHKYTMDRYTFGGVGNDYGTFNGISSSRTQYQVDNVCFTRDDFYKGGSVMVTDDSGTRTLAIPEDTGVLLFSIYGNATATATAEVKYTTMTVLLDCSTSEGAETISMSVNGKGFTGTTSAGGSVSYSFDTLSFTAYKPCGWSEADSKFYTTTILEMFVGAAANGIFDLGYEYSHMTQNGTVKVTGLS